MSGPRAHRLARAAIGPAVLALAAGFGGCRSDEPEPPPAVVGASPLRRLSNVEYLNALADLFPNVREPLPPLPDDGAVAGFENAVEAQRPSDVRVARYEAIASIHADVATRDPASVRALVGCDGWATDDSARACARTFLATTGRRVYRRPLEPAEADRLLARFEAWRTSIDFEAAVRLTLSIMLQAPQFLYRPEPAPAGAAPGEVVPVPAYAMATRLAFFLWESTPDDALLDAAARGELATEAGVRSHATRLLADPRARRLFVSFHRQWLGLDRILGDEHAARAAEVDPAWTRATQASAAEETRRFVDGVVGAGGTLGDLLTSRRAWVDAETARLYGVPAPPPGTWAEVSLPPDQRAGLFTRAAFLASFSHRGGTSPPVRGNGIQLRLLCQLPISPPPGVDLSQPKAAPGQGPRTTRDLFEERTRPAMCQGCHAGLNGFGYPFESYDASGRFRTTEVGLPVDPRGAIRGTDVDGAVSGPVELSEALARSETVRRCAATQWVRYALARAPDEVEGPMVAGLADRFSKSGGDVRDLVLAIATSPSFRAMRVAGGAP